jgi:hypothetical protein
MLRVDPPYGIDWPGTPAKQSRRHMGRTHSFDTRRLNRSSINTIITKATHVRTQNVVGVFASCAALARLVSSLVVLSFWPAIAADVEGVPASPAGSRLNVEEHAGHHGERGKSPDTKKTLVLPGDNVCTTVVAAESISTRFSVVNMATRPATVRVYFMGTDGTDLDLTIKGIGRARSTRIRINPLEVFSFETESTNAGKQGWALIEPEEIDDLVSGYCMLSARMGGDSTLELALPVVNRFYTRAVMPYRNTGGFSSVQLVNATPAPQIITATIHASGVTQTKSWQFGPWESYDGDVANLLASAIPDVGVVEFTSSSQFGFAATGIKWGDIGMTTLPVLTTVDWF